MGLAPAETGAWAGLEAVLPGCRPKQEEAQDQSPSSLSVSLQKEGVGRLLSSTPMVRPRVHREEGTAVWKVLCVVSLA